MTSAQAKTIIAALTVAALAASPALAKSRKHHTVTTPGQGIYNTVTPNTAVAAPGDPNARIGSDPDPQIRTELQRDYGSSLGAY